MEVFDALVADADFVLALALFGKHLAHLVGPFATKTTSDVSELFIQIDFRSFLKRLRSPKGWKYRDRFFPLAFLHLEPIDAPSSPEWSTHCRSGIAKLLTISFRRKLPNKALGPIPCHLQIGECAQKIARCYR